MAPKNQVTMLETTLAQPPQGTLSELSFPLSFCDIMWVGSTPPIQRLIFYELSISKSHFVEVIIPNLKKSLSLALQHFPALAGNLIVPRGSSSPEIRYANGDSVPLVFAESSLRDFDCLVSDQARNCVEFYPLVPRLPKSSNAPGFIGVPLLAVQVTLFPEIGVCIGISNQHCVADGSTMYAFTKAWTTLSKLDDEGISSLSDEYVQFYDREVMRDTKELADVVMKSIRDRVDAGTIVLDHPQALPDETDKVRAMFTIRPEDVKRLKTYISKQRSSTQHLSTFTVVSALVWTCMLKSGNAVTDSSDDDETEYFGCVADCRGRGDPPIPTNYFGNCLSYIMTSAKSRELIKEEGILIAAELIGEAIHKRLKNKDGPFNGLGSLFSEYAKVKTDRILTVAGSPRQNYYEMDFGFGKPRKFEFVSIDMTGAFSISSSKESGSLEIGLSLPKAKMDAFVRFFEEGLKVL